MTPQPLALVVSTDDLTWDAAQRLFSANLSEIDPTFWIFHQANYRGFGIRSAKTGVVLPFFIDSPYSVPTRYYVLRPTAMALEICPKLAGARLVLKDDTDRVALQQLGAHRRAADLAEERATAAIRAGDLTAAQAYSFTATTLARHASCPGL